MCARVCELNCNGYLQEEKRKVPVGIVANTKSTGMHEAEEEAREVVKATALRLHTKLHTHFHRSTSPSRLHQNKPKMAKTSQSGRLLLLPLAALLAAALLLPLVRSDAAVAAGSAPTAYDELRLRGFPRGLLPANVRGYTLDAGSGDFAVDLTSSCRIVLPAGSYLANFNDRLTGHLDDRRISGLSGIRVRAFFRWWSITGIRADGDELVFEVGSVSAKFPARHFNASLECPGTAAS